MQFTDILTGFLSSEVVSVKKENKSVKLESVFLYKKKILRI